jgi:hypothetical protein
LLARKFFILRLFIRTFIFIFLTCKVILYVLKEYAVTTNIAHHYGTNKTNKVHHCCLDLHKTYNFCGFSQAIDKIKVITSFRRIGIHENFISFILLNVICKLQTNWVY